MALFTDTPAYAHVAQRQAHWSDRLALWERSGVGLLTLLAIFLTTSSGYFLFVVPDETSAARSITARDNPIYMLLWLTFYLASLGAFAWTILTRGLNKSFFLGLGLIMLVLASATWSVNMKTTLFFGIMFCMNAVAAYALSQLIHPDRFLRLLGGYLMFALIWSYAMLVLGPDHVIETRWGGSWTGVEFSAVFSHKSDAGYYFSVLFLIALSGRAFGFSQTACLAAMIAVVLTLPLTNSATSLLALLALWLHFSLVARQEAMHRQTLIVLSGLMLAASIAFPHIDLGTLPEYFGRDAGMTGRAPLWESAKEYIAQQPTFGYGYYGFFATNTFSPVWDLWAQNTYFKTPHFHNSSLDIMISLGVVGLVFYVLIVASAIAIIFNQSLSHHVRITYLTILTLFLISATFDFTIFKHNAFASLFLFYVCFAAQTRYRATSHMA